MEKQLHELLYAMPLDTGYACDLSELDDEDMPRDRIPKLKALLSKEDDVLACRVACILGHLKHLHLRGSHDAGVQRSEM